MGAITANVDLDAKGKQWGSLDVPCSTDRSAWGTVRVPVCVINGGAGPTVALTGGSHGDEYEGPIALGNLARRLQADDLAGRVIILPRLNLPAVQAAARTSPLDGGNMNRAFPGDPKGGVTAKIADWVQTQVIPRADCLVDLHSGGKTLEFLPFSVIHQLDDKARMQASLAALKAFGAPFGLVLLELDNVGMLDTAVEEAGKIFISTELGGGGTARASTVRIAERGIDGILHHFGLTKQAPPGAPTRLLDTPDGTCYVVADGDGICEPLVDLGETVEAGAPVARIHAVERPQDPPQVYCAGRSGLLVGRHFPGLIRHGDCLALIAVDWGGA